MPARRDVARHCGHERDGQQDDHRCCVGIGRLTTRKLAQVMREDADNRGEHRARSERGHSSPAAQNAEADQRLDDNKRRDNGKSVMNDPGGDAPLD